MKNGKEDFALAQKALIYGGEKDFEPGDFKLLRYHHGAIGHSPCGDAIRRNLLISYNKYNDKIRLPVLVARFEGNHLMVM